MRCRLFASLFVVAFLLAGAVHAAGLTVFAAASLKEALDAQVASYSATRGVTIDVAYAGTNVLAKQIVAGAPADIFISADEEWMDYLESRKMLAPGTRQRLLRNALVLIAPAASKVSLHIDRNFALADALGTGRLAVANPDAVPAGRYARSALDALGVWASVAGRLARAENTRAALKLVARGEAPLGIVYSTDALADGAVRIVDTFPEGTHPPIVYPIALVTGGRAAQAQPFVSFLASDAARASWTRFGFAPSP